LARQAKPAKAPVGEIDVIAVFVEKTKFPHIFVECLGKTEHTVHQEAESLTIL
jgi:hypothetical protein